MCFTEGILKFLILVMCDSARHIRRVGAPFASNFHDIKLVPAVVIFNHGYTTGILKRVKHGRRIDLPNRSTLNTSTRMNNWG